MSQTRKVCFGYSCDIVTVQIPRNWKKSEFKMFTSTLFIFFTYLVGLLNNF